jgi:GTPase
VTLATPEQIVDRIRSGDARAAARAISLLEDDAPEAATISALLFPHTGQARILGITGPPGAGKSTLIDRLTALYRGRNESVGVIAVDPTSPFTGGALLGDRIRMSAHATDRGVFVRSMATRGHLGGLASAVPSAIRVLDALGKDVVLVETVGVGQSELEIAGIADCTVLVFVPNLGDDVQMIKAGIMEIGDVFVVNKSDLPGAEDTRKRLERAIQDKGPVLTASADRGEAISAVAEAIDHHFEKAERSGALEIARRAALQNEILAHIDKAARRFALERAGAEIDRAVASRAADPSTIAAEVLDRWLRDR